MVLRVAKGRVLVQDAVRLNLLLREPVDLVVPMACMLELAHHVLLVRSTGMSLAHQASVLKMLRVDFLIAVEGRDRSHTNGMGHSHDLMTDLVHLAYLVDLAGKARFVTL